MAAIFGEGKIFGKLQRLHSLDTLRVENFDEIALSLTVSEILANYSKVVLKIHNQVPGYYSCTDKAISPKCNTKRAMDITILYSKL